MAINSSNISLELAHRLTDVVNAAWKSGESFIKLDKVAKTKKPIFCLMIYGFCLLNIWDSSISITTLTGTQSNGKNFYTFF